MVMEPIGYFKTNAIYKSETPRQSVFDNAPAGIIDLLPGFDFETALRDLDGFERLWIIFQFHKNSTWRPTTAPPVGAPGKKRVGVFASRSPYRPNPIGLSCVRLLRIERLKLFIGESDLLNETPILDIKPYIPEADAFPAAKAGWVDLQADDVWNVQIAEIAKAQNDFLLTCQAPDILAVSRLQLSHAPLNHSRKRVKILQSIPHTGIFAFRTFRILFRFNELEKEIFIESIHSGYSEQELNISDDPYDDKEIHRNFLKAFPPTFPIDKYI